MTPHVDPRLLEDAEGPERAAMLAHLQACGACRSRAASHDPSILFALLALAPVPERVLTEVSSEVARRVGADRTSFGLSTASAWWPRRAAVAAIVTLTVVSGFVTLHERVEEPAAVVQAEPQPRADVDVGAGGGVSQVIDLTVGETQIVMVYNGDLNL